ncbi:MAG: hypothetical protein JWL59_3064 [Chthoniobacteraceae bacterium]|nr:hypothetical protein [Chthoniobacteraceae bacterium]
MTEEQISALLRLKRYEQPPKGYFDQLLKDIHRKQRSELLRRSLWQIALERLQTFFGSHSMGSLSYAGAMGCMLIVGLVGIGLLTPSELQSEAGAIASVKTAPPPPRNLLSLQQSDPFLPSAQMMPAAQLSTGQSPRGRMPRYVIDALPASYEQSFDF